MRSRVARRCSGPTRCGCGAIEGTRRRGPSRAPPCAAVRLRPRLRSSPGSADRAPRSSASPRRPASQSASSASSTSSSTVRAGCAARKRSAASCTMCARYTDVRSATSLPRSEPVCRRDELGRQASRRVFGGSCARLRLRRGHARPLHRRRAHRHRDDAPRGERGGESEQRQGGEVRGRHGPENRTVLSRKGYRRAATRFTPSGCSWSLGGRARDLPCRPAR